ncbi:hypothetical protein DW049_16880 [Ruminococcus sp. AF41-9]|nr:hypothetical protein DW049_16880 [Ruminococcus sp. AF41-9]
MIGDFFIIIIISVIIHRKNSFGLSINDKSITYGDAEPEYTSKITQGSLVGKDDLKLTYSREKGTATAASANSNLYKKLAFVV